MGTKSSRPKKSGLAKPFGVAAGIVEATVIGAVSVRGAGMLISGCVFFICTVGADLAGGSGSTVMRAVSFFGPGEGSRIGVIAGIAAVVAGADVWDGCAGNRVVGGLDIDGVSAVAVAVEEGGDGGKNGKGFVGGDGDGASGIFGGGGAERSGGVLVDRALTPLPGGLIGKLIRTVSRAEASPVVGDGRGGKVIRTVSFFGSCGSIMRNVATRNIDSRVCQAAPYMPRKIFSFRSVVLSQ